MYRNCIADLQLSVDDIDEDYIKQSKAILISGTALAESPSREAAIKAVMLAKKNNTKETTKKNTTKKKTEKQTEKKTEKITKAPTKPTAKATEKVTEVVKETNSQE